LKASSGEMVARLWKAAEAVTTIWRKRQSTLRGSRCQVRGHEYASTEDAGSERSISGAFRFFTRNWL
jgi:hypothetical protein